jgi:hypothetical protein
LASVVATTADDPAIAVVEEFYAAAHAYQEALAADKDDRLAG